jgi:hypothetical protein
MPSGKLVEKPVFLQGHCHQWENVTGVAVSTRQVCHGPAKMTSTAGAKADVGNFRGWLRVPKVELLAAKVEN